jgi:cytochrome oxidase Cu insertion factor (SCO1/SenC/PrrC family)
MNVQRSRLARGAGAALVLAGLAWVATPIWAGGAKLKEGDAAPDIELQATNVSSIFPDKKDGKTFKLSDLKGKKNVVLWFYPKALTGG